MLADAACELFLERGYEATSVTEITRRAGVSRSSFFNYFSSKAEMLWFVFDARVAVLERALREHDRDVGTALRTFAAGEVPEILALAIAEGRTMDVEGELEIGRAVRQLRIAAAIEARLRRDGHDARRAEIVAAGYAAALVGTVWRWALLGAGRHRLDALLEGAIVTAEEMHGSDG